jgi:Domain of unknown function (DUF1788)
MSSFQHPSNLDRAVDALKKDLLLDGGPQISTLRNYNFAILPYDPTQEFTLRQRINTLCEELRAAGWNTATIALHALLLQRLRRTGDDYLQSLIDREKRLFEKSPERGLEHVKDKVVDEIEGPDGLAADVVTEIRRILDADTDNHQRTVIFIGRAGALYPFFRTSALLKHVADHTHNVPVVLLYPGTPVGDTGLSFMGILPADRDYRPRIYR